MSTAKIAKARLQEVIAQDRRMEPIERIQMASRTMHRAIAAWENRAKSTPWQTYFDRNVPRG